MSSCNSNCKQCYNPKSKEEGYLCFLLDDSRVDSNDINEHEFEKYSINYGEKGEYQ